MRLNIYGGGDNEDAKIADAGVALRRYHNAGFETRVLVTTRGERRREYKLRVALTKEREDRVE